MVGRVDITVLIGLVGDNPATLEKLALKALDSFESALGEMAMHLTANNITEFGMVSHKIKSVALTVGAYELAALLATGSNFRTALDEGNDAQEVMRTILTELPRTAEALRVELEHFILGRSV